MRVTVRPLADHDDRRGFSCGVAALDRYLREQAGQDQRKNLARVFVAEGDAPGVIAGFYTLSTIGIELGALPPKLAKRIPYPEAPAALIGRLAVARRFQKQGLGEYLLVDALRRIVEIGQSMAILAIVVDVKEGAVSFYEKYGFLRLASRADRVFLPFATARKLF